MLGFQLGVCMQAPQPSWDSRPRCGVTCASQRLYTLCQRATGWAELPSIAYPSRSIQKIGTYPMYKYPTASYVLRRSSDLCSARQVRSWLASPDRPCRRIRQNMLPCCTGGLWGGGVALQAESSRLCPGRFAYTTSCDACDAFKLQLSPGKCWVWATTPQFRRSLMHASYHGARIPLVWFGMLRT